MLFLKTETGIFHGWLIRHQPHNLDQTSKGYFAIPDLHRG